MTDIPPGATVEHINVDGKTGVIVRAANGHFLPGTTAKHTISQADASTLAKTRWDRHRQAVIDGALDAIAEDRKIPRGEAEKIGFQRPIAKAQAMLALSGQRESTRAAEFVFAHAGYPSGSEASGTGGVRLEVWGDALDRVLDALRPRDQPDIIDATDAET